ncbi:phosphorylase family protein [Pantoea stewartii]|uniref:5'-methylthioadenosine/S-adenosylhomocysteine nucleosidase family protein n=1 Tax=Pantoea stewartii TaxID=66269 RepID=UPI0006D0BEC8|nr:hypothetical protein [Pantoea stewartii]
MVVSNTGGRSVSIDGYKGLCLLPARMGLVNMAITSSKAIELFQPKIVAMSGICAGVKGETNYLDLVIGDTCWEYQTGKYKDKKFVQEPYQVSLTNEIRTELSHFIDSDDVVERIKRNIFATELLTSKIKLGLFSSGSAVIADDLKMKQIGEQHRKLSAIEMEMYSLYESAYQSQSKPEYFGVKSVVDLGDKLKDDSFHAPACVLSARLVAEFINYKMGK